MHWNLRIQPRRSTDNEGCCWQTKRNKSYFLIAGCIFLQYVANNENHRHNKVRKGVENDGTLRISEPRRKSKIMTLSCRLTWRPLKLLDLLTQKQVRKWEGKTSCFLLQSNKHTALHYAYGSHIPYRFISKRKVHRVKKVTTIHNVDMKSMTNRTANSSSSLRYIFGHGGEQLCMPRKEYLKMNIYTYIYSLKVEQRIRLIRAFRSSWTWLYHKHSQAVYMRSICSLISCRKNCTKFGQKFWLNYDRVVFWLRWFVWWWFARLS